MRVTYADIHTERNHAGAWLCSAIVDGYLVTRRYWGYTKREATRMFHTEVNGG